jgi:uncharacterized FlaG/YvyC family protein
LSSINGIDPIITDIIKIPTQKPIITETHKTIISDDHKHKDQNQHHDPYAPEDQPQQLSAAVEKLNRLLQQNKIPLYFQIIEGQPEVKLQLTNSATQAIIALVSPERVFKLVAEFKTRGFALDELI